MAALKNESLRKRIDRRKAEMAARGEHYEGQPEATAVVQFFNHRPQIPELIARLRSAFQEIIIVDDGSIDGSYRDWPRFLTRPNDFLLRCNDLHEVRTYDRAIRMARGRIVCLLQDDDLPPCDGGWLERAIRLFAAFPKLTILGGRRGFDLMLPDVPRHGVAGEYRQEGDIAGCPGINKYRVFDRPSRRIRSPATSFMFTMFINRAPMFVRRAEFLGIGGIRQEFAPFQCDDVDCCLRAWKAGLGVGFYDSGFRWNVAMGGMRGFCSDAARRQVRTNWKRIYREHGRDVASGALQNAVDGFNAELSRLIEHTADNAG